MCELKLKTKFREGDSVHLIPTTYLKYFEDHGAMDGKIKQVLTSVHSEYVPEYVVETENGLGAAVKIMDRFFRHRKVPLHRKIFKTQISA